MDTKSSNAYFGTWALAAVAACGATTVSTATADALARPVTTRRERAPAFARAAIAENFLYRIRAGWIGARPCRRTTGTLRSLHSEHPPCGR